MRTRTPARSLHARCARDAFECIPHAFTVGHGFGDAFGTEAKCVERTSLACASWQAPPNARRDSENRAGRRVDWYSSVMSLVRVATGAGLLTVSLTIGCAEEGLPCAADPCWRGGLVVTFLGDAGVVAPVGRVRLGGVRTEGRSFDCRDEDAGAGIACRDGALTNWWPALTTDSTLEVRFELSDGRLTSWQSVPVTVIKEEDVRNGCDHGCWVIAPVSVNVPEEAMWAGAEAP